jgi:threonine dehydrogenase-like Zn-dependent dehydrogenase
MMKQIAQNYKSGELTVLDVPAPACRPGGVLVQSLFSLISTGTEMMKLAEAKMSMVGKARARPDQVRKVLDTVAQQGAVSTYKKVMSRLDSYTPLGYSLCGVIVEVGKGAEEFQVGQLVAAAGNEYALHAEYNWIPVNLCAPVPRGVSPEHAAFATVGSIAMHGVRRAEVQLGDTACVIGLGLVGQLVVRLLVASGVRVIGLDMISQRCRLAEQAGAVLCAAPEDEGMEAARRSVDEISGGRGVDHVFLAAGGSSNGPVEVAARLARDRARVVDIGKTRLDLPWNAYYEKELDVRFSRSYGPGRYDERYELEGIDYPIGYVRWTERRNLECFLDLLARKEIEVETLVSGVFPLAGREQRLRRPGLGLAQGRGRPARVPGQAPGQPAEARRQHGHEPGAQSGGAAPRGTSGGRLKIGFIGAGNYASSMLLPHLARLDKAHLAHVATSRSLSAVNAQRRFGFTTASTRRRRRVGGRQPGRDLHRDPSSYARGPGLPGAGDGQGRLRGKAPGPDPRRARPYRRGHRDDGQRPADGGIQPALRAAAHPAEIAVRARGLEFGHAVPGQRGAAGRRQLVPERRAGRIAVRRRGRSFHRHAELVGGQPARTGLRRQGTGEGRRAGHGAVR